jgi:hypothetical protein
MKSLVLAAAAAICVAFAGCASVTQNAATFQAQVAKACSVVQPTAMSVAAMTTDPVQKAVLDKFVTDNAAVCAASASVDPSTVTNLINTSIPAAIQVIALIPIDDSAKLTVQIGLIAFQTALSAALLQYGSPVAPVPASGAVAS